MNTTAIIHRSTLPDLFSLNQDTAVVNIRTGKDITAVNLIHEDPYAYGISGDIHWIGDVLPMQKRLELKHCNIWTVQLNPKYKRLQYYFEVFCGEEKLLMFEDDFYTEEEISVKGRCKQYYKLPWMNPSDIIYTPDWVANTVWYQIMPDRFCRGNSMPKRMMLKDWDDRETVDFEDFYGGDLRGIIDKLPYLKSLGITGIYLLPIFLSGTNHKYNTYDYKMVDPDFGTEDDVRELIDTAHSMGMRIMFDAVFNHTGTEFFAWKDVWENGEESRYFEWFCINQKPFERKYASLRDARFYGFEFLDNMPKLNTGNPEVVEYCTALCRYWVKEWDVDGIRFDVGNEVSHSFLKQLHTALKPMKPELFLLGEIWHDSLPWLQGDEYDSVMNYPFFESMHNFWLDKHKTSADFMYAINRVYSLYPEQINRCIFNFLDTHDTMRARTRCGDLDAFFQQLTVLMTMPGTACIFYGTEIALPGGHDPDCRRTMPWKEIEEGCYDVNIMDTKSLITLRHTKLNCSSTDIAWHHTPDNPRLVCYDRPSLTGKLRVLLNAGDLPVDLEDYHIVCYARNFRNGILHPGGICITQIDTE